MFLVTFLYRCSWMYRVSSGFIHSAYLWDVADANILPVFHAHRWKAHMSPSPFQQLQDSAALRCFSRYLSSWNWRPAYFRFLTCFCAARERLPPDEITGVTLNEDVLCMQRHKQPSEFILQGWCGFNQYCYIKNVSQEPLLCERHYSFWVLQNVLVSFSFFWFYNCSVICFLFLLAAAGRTEQLWWTHGILTCSALHSRQS